MHLYGSDNAIFLAVVEFKSGESHAVKLDVQPCIRMNAMLVILIDYKHFRREIFGSGQDSTCPLSSELEHVIKVSNTCVRPTN